MLSFADLLSFELSRKFAEMSLMGMVEYIPVFACLFKVLSNIQFRVINILVTRI